MPKLRTFILIHDITKSKVLVLKNLKVSQRNLLAKLKCGVVPLELQIGYHKDVPIEERLCYDCNMGYLEDAIHMLFSCLGYAKVIDWVEFNIP